MDQYRLLTKYVDQVNAFRIHARMVQYVENRSQIATLVDALQDTPENTAKSPWIPASQTRARMEVNVKDRDWGNTNACAVQDILENTAKNVSAKMETNTCALPCTMMRIADTVTSWSFASSSATRAETPSETHEYFSVIN